MSTTIVKEDIKKVFEERIKQLPGQDNRPGLSAIFDSTIDFYENYKIEGIDTSYFGEDRLLFEYGIYDWQDGKGENFTITIIRDFFLNPEAEATIDFSQLHLVLYYAKENFIDIEPFASCSSDFEAISHFKDFITASNGFTIAANTPLLSYEILLIDPD